LHNEAITKALETSDRTMKKMVAAAQKRIEAKKPAQLTA
jgi:hypothetical protein